MQFLFQISPSSFFSFNTRASLFQIAVVIFWISILWKKSYCKVCTSKYLCAKMDLINRMCQKWPFVAPNFRADFFIFEGEKWYNCHLGFGMHVPVKMLLPIDIFRSSSLHMTIIVWFTKSKKFTQYISNDRKFSRHTKLYHTKVISYIISRTSYHMLLFTYCQYTY